MVTKLVEASMPFVTSQRDLSSSTQFLDSRPNNFFELFEREILLRVNFGSSWEH